MLIDDNYHTDIYIGRLVHKLLKVMKRQHYIIKGHNMMTSDLQNEYTSIQQIAAGQELQWEDQLEDSTIRPGYRLSEMLDLPCLSRKLSLPGIILMRNLTRKTRFFSGKVPNHEVLC